MLRRALILRCPVCGSGGIFRRWFDMADRCPRCGLRFERIEGHWLGSLGINTVLTFSLLFVVVIVGVSVTVPDVPVGPLVGLTVGLAVLVPLVLFPFTRTLWTAIDLRVRPLESHELHWPEPRGGPGGEPPGERGLGSS